MNFNLKKIEASFFLLTIPLLLIFSQAKSSETTDETEADTTEYVSSTFRSSRVINNHSVEHLGRKVIDFRVNHRFGSVNRGAYELFGLDNSRARMTFDYGLTDRSMIGIGRSSGRKIYEGYYRVNLLRQRKDDNIPLTLTWFSNISHISDRNFIPIEHDDISRIHRLGYVHQIIIGRKFSDFFSIQISPTLVHNNLVPTNDIENTIGVLGIGGRIQFIQNSSITAEYTMIQPGTGAAEEYTNALSIGVDIETEGHVFQLHFTNSREMAERTFLSENQGSWLDGEIHFGFNLSRKYDFKKHE